MGTKYRIPLSYNPVQMEAFSHVIKDYSARDHMELVSDFEAKIARYTGASHVVALNSGTSAIHLALKSVGVGPGDRVLAPTFTYVATINPILYLGAEPIFIDSEWDTWNIDPELVLQTIQRLKKEALKPKAIIVAHTYGGPAKMDQLMSICKEEGISLVEDAAESLGAHFQGRMTGTLSDVGIYSFNNNKTLTTYGGGALLTEHKEIAEKVKFWASQSRENHPFYLHAEVGYNYRMSPLNAAYGLAHWPMMPLNIGRRVELAENYSKGLSGIAKIQGTAVNANHSRWLSALVFENREIVGKITKSLDNQGIEYRRLWNPLQFQPLCQKFQRVGGEVAKSLFERGLCLPSGNNLKTEDQSEIVGLIKNSIGGLPMDQRPNL